MIHESRHPGRVPAAGLEGSNRSQHGGFSITLRVNRTGGRSSPTSIPSMNADAGEELGDDGVLLCTRSAHCSVSHLTGGTWYPSRRCMEVGEGELHRVRR